MRTIGSFSYQSPLNFHFFLGCHKPNAHSGILYMSTQLSLLELASIKWVLDWNFCGAFAVVKALKPCRESTSPCPNKQQLHFWLSHIEHEGLNVVCNCIQLNTHQILPTIKVPNQREDCYCLQLNVLRISLQTCGFTAWKSEDERVLQSGETGCRQG